MRRTSTQKQADLDRAYEHLECVKLYRLAWKALTDLGYRLHGDGNGVLISGIEREHWPSELKDDIRKTLRGLNREMDAAQLSWRLSGKRLVTFRRVIEGYRVDGCRY